MARPYIHEEVSQYYPPRARWYSKIYYPFNALRRHLALDRLVLPTEMRCSQLLAGLLVPGLAVWFRRPKTVGRLALAGASLLLLVFIAGLGYPVGNLAFGLLISLHVSGVVFYCEPMLAREPFQQRIGLTVLIMLLVGLGLYLPARNWAQAHLFMPLRLHNRVIVMQPSTAFQRVHRGDWVAYEMEENSSGDPHNGGAVRVAGGMGFGPVLALPGDEVTFSTSSFAVNGVSQPLWPHMPTSGGFTVVENRWFIWPDFGISGHGNVGEANLSGAMMNFANVNVNQYRGHPFHSWFGRKQILP
jgi:hypothetical protein